MKRREFYEYYGHVIYRAGLNSSGIRWYTTSLHGYYLKADTLKGIKELIKEEATK